MLTLGSCLTGFYERQLGIHDRADEKWAVGSCCNAYQTKNHWLPSTEEISKDSPTHNFDSKELQGILVLAEAYNECLCFCL